jgi:hypothetical protein
MTVFTEGKHTAEFLLSEGNGSISREQVTIAAAAPALAAGTLMGRLTSGGQCVAYNNTADDGSQTAIGILYAAVPNESVAQKATIIARSAEVLGAELTGLDAPGTADLAALGIIVR